MSTIMICVVYDCLLEFGKIGTSEAVKHSE